MTNPPRPTPTGGGGWNDEEGYEPDQPLHDDSSQPLHDDSSQPLHDDSSQLNTTLTAPSTPTPSPTQVQTPQPPESDYARHFHDYTEADYKQNQEFAQAVPEKFRAMFRGDDISSNDLDRIKFGSEEPATLTAARRAQSEGQQQLAHFAQSINAGDADAVGTADDILRPAEPALAFFRFFAPAYNDWTGAAVSYQTIKHAYEAEYGLSFAAYSSDSTTMADLAERLVNIEQDLTNAYNQLVPTWRGTAASSFEAKMAVFFSAAGTVSQNVSVVGKDVAALVHGLQQLVLTKAQTVSEIYVDTLPNDIDGAMAATLVKVAKGQADKQTNLIAFYLLGGQIEQEGGFLHGVANFFSGGLLGGIEQAAAEDAAAQAAPTMAADWCNSVLVPQFETREKALTTVNTDTQHRIQQAFQQFTGQLSGLQDPFTAMAKAHGSTATTPQSGSPSGGSGGIGGGGVGGDATSPTAPSAIAPSGLPAGASWIPAGVPVPSGWNKDPATGAVLPQGWTVDPQSGRPSAPAAVATAPAGINPNNDVRKNSDGSVSFGPDRALTITAERGKQGAFTLTSTAADGSQHTYSVHFDRNGDPVVTEVVPGPGADGLTGSSATGPAAEPAGGGNAATGAGGGGGAAIGGGGGAGIGGGISGGSAAIAGGIGAAPAHAGMAAAATPGSSGQLHDGVHVGADNTMTASGPAAPSSPVAGSAAAGPDGGDQHGGGVGGVPFAGGGRGAGGGDQEAGRRYQQRGDVVDEDELAQWQRMGPVIGEQ